MDKLCFCYTAYGLEIHACLPLPELLPGEAGRQVDVTIRTGTLTPPPTELLTEGRYAHADSQEAYLFWEEVGQFIVKNGREVIFDPHPNAPEQVLRLFLLGSVLAMVLHQRGYLALHASAVALENRVIAFVGQKGFGKSTTAAAFHACGHTLLTDDMVAIDIAAPQPLVLPGFPQFKLWPESAQFLGDDPALLSSLVPVSGFEKRARPVRDGFAKTPLPLHAIYLLDDGDYPEIEPIPAARAFVELLPHWQIARLGLQPAEILKLREYVLKCSRLLNTIPTFALKRPYGLVTLPEIVQLVETHQAVS